jgi:heterodisulfide reductase subunit C
MKYVSLPDREVADSAFAEQVSEQSGVNVNRCYQCLTCTLSCPSVFAMDYFPHQLVRLVQLGAKAEVLRSATIWVCASCETCVTRCPNEIDIPRLMDTLRQMAMRENISGKEKTAPVYHRAFLKSVRQLGKPYELGMLIELKLKTRDFFSDLGMGIKMLRKGKLSLLPGRIKGHKEIGDIFQRSEKGRDQ